MNTAEDWMRQAIAAAILAAAEGEVPIGCVIVHDPTGKMIACQYNRRESECDPTAHAEILALREAGLNQGSWRLLDCTLIVTLEPCPMCAGAIVNARIPRLIYGCPDPKAGAVNSLFQLCNDPRLNHRVQITAGVLADQCSQLLTDFFSAQRLLGKK
jgi:tRNA(adenine34) deaminase